MKAPVKTFLILTSIFLMAGLAMLVWGSKGEYVLLLDRNHTPFFDHFFKYFTTLGDGVWFVPWIIILLFVKYSWSASFAALGALQLLLVQGLKRGVFGKMPRPAKFFEGEHVLQQIDGVEMHQYYSMPSGHTATAFGILFLAVLLVRPGRGTSLILFLCALLVGISRMYLAQHFLEDIMLGALLGILSATIVWYVFQVLEKKYPSTRFFNGAIGKK